MPTKTAIDALVAVSQILTDLSKDPDANNNESQENATCSSDLIFIY